MKENIKFCINYVECKSEMFTKDDFEEAGFVLTMWNVNIDSESAKAFTKKVLY